MSRRVGSLGISTPRWRRSPGEAGAPGPAESPSRPAESPSRPAESPSRPAESPSRPAAGDGRGGRFVPAGVTLPWLRSQPRALTRIGASVVWLAFIVFPLIDAIENQGTAGAHAAAIAATVVFVIDYLVLVFLSFAAPRPWVTYSLVAVLVIIAGALTLADRPGWAYLFTYCAACSVLIGPEEWTFWAVLGCAGLAAGSSAINDSASTALGAGASTLGVGLLMVLMRDLRARNEELQAARAELAEIAVAAERERFARDLHDLLGHTLSVIALKAELAGKLVRDQPERAVAEVGEVETVARDALSEVRQVVSGYRQPTLDGELSGARMALTAAGIVIDVQRPAVGFDPEVEAVLAWTVREGATNVIRHSGARRCTVRVSAHLGSASAELVDDGRGANGGKDVDGHGLEGLRERAEALGGRVEAVTQATGGFRLAVTVPWRPPVAEPA